MSTVVFLAFILAYLIAPESFAAWALLAILVVSLGRETILIVRRARSLQ